MKRIIITAATVVLVLVLSIIALLYFGIIHINNPSESKYPVRGVDVSCYQGDIDWDKLSAQDISFAFIKATEGSSFVDPNFLENWKNASRTNLRIGAYHFFSFESSGEKQADLFCKTVSVVDKMLPPVIDVEYYGQFKSEKDISAKNIKANLRTMVDRLTKVYGVKPILYVTQESFDSIVQDDFSDCDLWYRSVYSSVPQTVDWKFWQFSNRHCLQGYEGEERYIDMNVFFGSIKDFEKYGVIDKE